MNKTAIGAVIGVIAIGAVVVFVLNLTTTNNGTDLQANDPGNSIPRPAVQAVPNTFSIMTPEEKVAAEEAARLAAEAAAQASSSATTTEEEMISDEDSEAAEQTN